MVFITMSLFILNSAISVEKCLELKLATFSCIEFLHGLITHFLDDLLIFVSEKGPLIIILNGVNMCSTTNTDEFDNQNQSRDSCKGDAHNERQNMVRYNVKHFYKRPFKFSNYYFLYLVSPC